MHWRAVPRTSKASLGCSHCDGGIAQTNFNYLPRHGSEMSSCRAVMVCIALHTAKPGQAARTMLVLSQRWAFRDCTPSAALPPVSVILPASPLTMAGQKKIVTWEFLCPFINCCFKISVNSSCSPSVCWWDIKHWLIDFKGHTCVTLVHADEHLQNWIQ